MANIVNLQRKVAVNLEFLRKFADSLAETPPTDVSGTFSIALVSDRRMKQLNELFRGKDSTTDVLSFPHVVDEFDPDKDNLGDIVISLEQAERQALENNLSLENELQQLVLHG